MGPGQIIKNRINLDLIEIIQFCLKISDLLRHTPPMGGCMVGWVDGWVNMWEPWGCGDHMGTTWRQHGDNMRTMWRQHGDVKTMWGQHRYNMGTTWRQYGDVETMWGQHGDNMGTT